MLQVFIHLCSVSNLEVRRKGGKNTLAAHTIFSPQQLACLTLVLSSFPVCMAEPPWKQFL